MLQSDPMAGAEAPIPLGQIREEEQRIRDLEIRYGSTLEALVPRKSHRREYTVLGDLDGVPIVEVQSGFMLGSTRSENEPRLDPDCYLKGRKYYWLASKMAHFGWGSIRRSVGLTQEGIPHVFGVVPDNEQTLYETGIYVPWANLDDIRQRHAAEVSKSYPTVQTTLDQLEGLNVSSDFVYWVESPKVGLTVLGNQQSPVIVRPNSANQPTKILIQGLDISVGDPQQPPLDIIRDATGAEKYTKGWLGWEFHFNKVLSPREIAIALKSLGMPEQGTYAVSLFRLSDRLRGMVNLPLAEAIVNRYVTTKMAIDFNYKRSRHDPRISLEMF